MVRSDDELNSLTSVVAVKCWYNVSLLIVSQCSLAVTSSPTYTHTEIQLTTTFMVLTSWLRVIARVHQVHAMNAEQRQTATDFWTKLTSLMYWVNHNTAPSYLSELCVPCSDTRLRSTTRGNYMIPRTHKHLANHAFAIAAPYSWNSLPDNVHHSESYIQT